MNDDNERIPVDMTPDKSNGRDNLDVVVLEDDQVSSSMKYPQRQAELEYLMEIYKDLGLQMIPPLKGVVFEGQAEIKWFHGGTKAIGAYGFRSTKKSFEVLEKNLDGSKVS